jgi:hypothetical protein
MTATIATTATFTVMSGEQLTAAIRHEHEAASQAASAALQHALEAGRLLDEARATIPHGAWEAYVKDSCGMAPRTARLYLRLHRHRDRLPDRQHVAGMSVRQAARLLEQPKAKVAEPVVADPASAEPAGGLRLRRPEWYREGYRHFGSHPSGWFFEVWPHPAGEQWAHYFICSPPSGHPGDEEGGSLVGPKRGIRVDAIEWSMNRQTVNGMPTLDDDGWKIGAQPCGLDGKTDEWASRFKPYNTMLFAGDDDYRRRGLGLKPKRKAGATA